MEENIYDIIRKNSEKYIFINEKYTLRNTYNKSQNGIKLIFGENAFDSMESAELLLNDLSDRIIVFDKSSLKINISTDLSNISTISSIGVTAINDDGFLDLADSVKANSKKTLTLNCANAQETDFELFLNVTVKRNSFVRDISGGNFSLSDETKVKESAKNIKTTEYHKNSYDAAGKINVTGSQVQNIQNYKNAVIQKSKIGDISNISYSFAQTTYADNGLIYKITVDEKYSSSGSLTYNNIKGKDAAGYSTVKITDTTAGDVSRITEDGKSYFKRKLTLNSDYSGGIFAGVAAETITYDRSGKITVKGGKTEIGDIANFNTVSVDGAAVGSISNEIRYKYTEKAFYLWDDLDDYGDFDEAQKELLNYTDILKSGGSVTLKKGAEADGISGFKTVKLDDADVTGNVDSGATYTEKYTANDNSESKERSYTRTGNFTAVNSIVDGSVENFATVKLTSSSVGNVKLCAYAKQQYKEINGKIIVDTFTAPTDKLTGKITLEKGSYAAGISNYASVIFKSSSAGVVENCRNVTFSEENMIASYCGTSGNDTFTINKKAVVTLTDSFDMNGGNDKLVVHGTLILDTDDISIPYSITGNGEIVTSFWYADNINIDRVINLGATTENFRGSAYEKADDTEKKAVKWKDLDNSYDGWLRQGVGCVDTVDYIKFTTDDWGIIEISSDQWLFGTDDRITLNGRELEIVDGKAVETLFTGTDYVLMIERRDEDSMSYSITIND